jgi:hypothetical protein
LIPSGSDFPKASTYSELADKAVKLINEGISSVSQKKEALSDYQQSEIKTLMSDIKKTDLLSSIENGAIRLVFENTSDTYGDIFLCASLHADGMLKEKYTGREYGNSPKQLFREITESHAWDQAMMAHYNISSGQLHKLNEVCSSSDSGCGEFFTNIPGLTGYVVLLDDKREGCTLISQDGTNTAVIDEIQLNRLQNIVLQVRLAGNDGWQLNNNSALKIDSMGEFKLEDKESQQFTM